MWAKQKALETTALASGGLGQMPWFFDVLCGLPAKLGCFVE
jgi:hypothetical protein